MGFVAWNAAYEKVGIANAIEVYYQDADHKRSHGQRS
jgi:hypothetical protein